MSVPFFYYSRSFAEFLYNQKGTIALTSFQAGKLIFISSPDGKTLIKYARNLKKPMGMAFENGSLAIACEENIEIFSGSETLATRFPDTQNKYDVLFVPITKLLSGPTDFHDIDFDSKGILAITTQFSCIARFESNHGMTPVWKPDFISEIVPEDRCHLNGMACNSGEPLYVTAFDVSDTKSGWRLTPFDTGVLIDVIKNKIVLNNLAMPHSPVYSNGIIYFLMSAVGRVMAYDIKTKSLKCLAEIVSYLRGLEIVDNYLIVGCSDRRTTSKSFENLPIKQNSCISGIRIIRIDNGEIIAGLTYTEHIKEIFSIRFLAGVERPAIITDSNELMNKYVHFSGGEVFYQVNESK
jgi:uncharacterized protein (TIGR03032 family)